MNWINVSKRLQSSLPLTTDCFLMNAVMTYHVFRLHSLVFRSNQVFTMCQWPSVTIFHPSEHQSMRTRILCRPTCGWSVTIIHVGQQRMPHLVHCWNKYLLVAGRQARTGLISPPVLPPDFTTASLPKSIINMSCTTHKYTMVHLWKGVKVGVWRSNEGTKV